MVEHISELDRVLSVCLDICLLELRVGLLFLLELHSSAMLQLWIFMPSSQSNQKMILSVLFNLSQCFIFHVLENLRELSEKHSHPCSPNFRVFLASSFPVYFFHEKVLPGILLRFIYLSADGKCNCFFCLHLTS